MKLVPSEELPFPGVVIDTSAPAAEAAPAPETEAVEAAPAAEAPVAETAAVDTPAETPAAEADAPASDDNKEG